MRPQPLTDENRSHYPPEHTGLEALHAALAERIRAADNSMVILRPLDPMARSVTVQPAPGTRGLLAHRVLLVEVKGHAEATLHPASRHCQAELQPACARARTVKSRLPRLLDHLCRSVGLDPAGRYCTHRHAIHGHVQAMSQTEVRAVLSQVEAWDWFRSAGLTWGKHDVRVYPHCHGYLIHDRTSGRLTDREERAAVEHWYLELHRRVQTRRQSLRVIQGARAAPRWRPSTPPGGTAA